VQQNWSPTSKLLRSGGSIRDRRTGTALSAHSLIILELRSAGLTSGDGRADRDVFFLDRHPTLHWRERSASSSRRTSSTRGRPEHKSFLGWLHRYLRNYEDVTRPAIAIQRQRVLPLADLVICPAGAELENIIAQAVAFLVPCAARTAKP